MDLRCKTCYDTFTSSEAHFRHFSLTHKLSTSSRFVCGSASCYVQCLTLERYNRHINDFHLSTSSGVVESLNEELHADRDGSLRCSHVGCDYVCNAKSSLRVHRRRKHESSSSSTVQTTIDIPLVSHASEDFEPPPLTVLSLLDHSTEPSSSTPTSLIAPRDLVINRFKQFYMALSAKYHIPESTIQFMIENQHVLAKECDNLLLNELLNQFQKCGLKTEQVEKIISDAIANGLFGEVHGPKGPLRSSYIRKKSYHSTFGYIAPTPHRLGLNKENVKRKFHTVSIKKTLESLFEDDSVFEQYLEMQTESSSSDDMIRDIHDGSLWKSHPVLSKDSSAVGVIFYEDDLELSDALKAAKGQHKITVIEFTLSNLRPWSRMKSGLIQLALIVCEKDVEYFGLVKILEKLIDELKELQETGINIRGKNVNVAPIMLLGDNLGTHIFTGFLENFSRSIYFCRYCTETREQWRKRWSGKCNIVEEDSEDDDSEADTSDDSSDESECDGENENTNENDEETGSTSECINLIDAPYSEVPLRTPQSYDDCVAVLQKRPSLESYKGIVANCPFNELKDFHCVKSSPPCIAHDLFEGVIAYDVSLALKYFRDKFSISSEFINRRIRSLKLLGRDKADRPAKVTDKMKKLRGSANQNWAFLRFLPLLIGDRIANKNDGVWKMMLLLIEVTRVYTSPAIPRASLPGLKKMSHLYLRMRCTLFPHVPIRPKHHYSLEHGAELIEIFGCLMRVGTLAFESKHKFFKTTAQARKIFKNITKTLSAEHQLNQSVLSVQSLTCNYPVMDNAVPFQTFSMSPEVKECLTSYFGEEYLKSMACSGKVTFHGVEYSKGEAVVHSSDNNKEVAMCLIEAVLMLDKSCYAAGWICKAELEENLQLFEVHKSTNCIVVNLNRLPDYMAYPLYKRNGKNVVLLKHITFYPTH